MMKRFLTLLLITCIWNVCYSQATASFTASVTIIQPIGITNISDLNFAEIDAKEGGEIILTPEETRIVNGTSSLGDASLLTAAKFQVTGEQGFTYTVNLPQNEYTLTNGKESIVIKNFTSNQNAKGNINEGINSFQVGATLVVSPRQAPGRYSSPSPLPVTVNYN